MLVCPWYFLLCPFIKNGGFLSLEENNLNLYSIYRRLIINPIKIKNNYHYSLIFALAAIARDNHRWLIKKEHSYFTTCLKIEIRRVNLMCLLSLLLTIKSKLHISISIFHWEETMSFALKWPMKPLLYGSMPPLWTCPSPPSKIRCISKQTDCHGKINKSTRRELDPIVQRKKFKKRRR